MAPDLTATRGFQLPKLQAIFKLSQSACFWDVRFCPYPGTDTRRPVFALIGTSHLLVCCLNEDDETLVNVLVTVKPESEHGKSDLDGMNSCTWCYVNPSEPLMAIAGDSGQISVVEVLSGKMFASLLGHGVGTINDLATHPVYPWIIASASMDTSIRIWDLRRIEDHHESSCIVICGHGQAHKEGLLTIGWHQSGRYIVSGGHDQKICVWSLPDLSPTSDFWHTISKEYRKRSSYDIHIIHYPHFISAAVHSNYIDKAVFFGDLLISKAAKEHKIVIWQITGFNSHRTPPGPESAPKSSEHLDTRNGFIRKVASPFNEEPSTAIEEQYQDKPLYQRLLELGSPLCESFYMRFGFLQPSSLGPDVHPILTMGNTNSEIRFWDLERLVLGHDGGLTDPRMEHGGPNASRRPAKNKKGLATKVGRARDRVSDLAASNSPSRPGSPDSSARSSSVTTFSTNQIRETSTEATSHVSDGRSYVESPLPDRSRYALDDAYKPLEEHKKVRVSELPGWTARAADWSRCGRWCLVVGEWQSTAVAVVLERPI